MPNLIVASVATVLAVVIAFGGPRPLRLPKRPASLSEAARRWWPYPVSVVVAIDLVAHRHVDQPTLLVLLGLFGTAVAIALVRALRFRWRVDASRLSEPWGGAATVEGGAAVPAPVDGTPTTAVVLPFLGDGVRTGTVTSVFKRPGEAVRVGKAICVVSIDKVDIEVPSDA